MSQQVLGSHLGLTFQQIQKYEKGMNRIGASRLQQIGRVLEVPASYFFEGAPGGWETGEGGRAANTFLELLGTRDGQSLVLSFSKIVDAKLRRSIVDHRPDLSRRRRLLVCPLKFAPCESRALRPWSGP